MPRGLCLSGHGRFRVECRPSGVRGKRRERFCIPAKVNVRAEPAGATASGGPLRLQSRLEVDVYAASTSVAPALAILTLVVSVSCSRLSLAEPMAKPLEPVAAILEAFQTHQVVALGEGLHGNEQGHAFRLALVRDSRFPTVVDDIVVEFGNARYQPLMDRFISGEDIPDRELRRVWQDTTMPNPLFDSPIYEEFFRSVRDVNASLPRERQVRVLLGDPPIQWEHVTTPDALQEWIVARDRHAADLVHREVLSKGRRALAIWGDGHFRRYSRWRGSPPEGNHDTLAALIERIGGTRVLTVWTNTTVELEKLQRDVRSWPVPSLALVRGTRLGKLNFKFYAGMETDPPTQMEDQYDAVLHLGPVSSITFSKLVAPALCADAEYTRMRLTRLALQPGGLAGHDAVEFKNFCNLQ